MDTSFIFLLKLQKNDNIKSIKEYITYEILRRELKNFKNEKIVKHTNTRKIYNKDLEKILKKYEINYTKYILNNKFLEIYSDYIELIKRKDVELYYSFNKSNSFFQYILSLKEIKNLLSKIKLHKLNLHNLTLLYAVLLKTYPTININYTEETIANKFDITKQYLNKLIRNLSLDKIYNFIVGKDLKFQLSFDDRLNKNQYSEFFLAKTNMELLKEETYFLGTQLLLPDYLLFKTTITEKDYYISNNLNYRINKYKDYYKNGYTFYTKFHKEFILLTKKYFNKIEDFEEPINFNNNKELLFHKESKLLRIKAKHYNIAKKKLLLYYILKNIEEKYMKDYFNYDLKFLNIKLLKKKLYLIIKNTDSIILTKLIIKFFKTLEELIKLEKKYDIEEKKLLESNLIEYLFLDKIQKYKIPKLQKRIKKDINNKEENIDKEKSTKKIIKTLINNKKIRKEVLIFIKKQLKIKENFITNKLVTLILDYLLSYGYKMEEIEKDIYDLIYKNKENLIEYIQKEELHYKDRFVSNLSSVLYIDLSKEILNNVLMEISFNTNYYINNIQNFKDSSINISIKKDFNRLLKNFKKLFNI